MAKRRQPMAKQGEPKEALWCKYMRPNEEDESQMQAVQTVPKAQVVSMASVAPVAQAQGTLDPRIETKIANLDEKMNQLEGEKTFVIDCLNKVQDSFHELIGKSNTFCGQLRNIVADMQANIRVIMGVSDQNRVKIIELHERLQRVERTIQDKQQLESRICRLEVIVGQPSVNLDFDARILRLEKTVHTLENFTKGALQAIDHKQAADNATFKAELQSHQADTRLAVQKTAAVELSCSKLLVELEEMQKKYSAKPRADSMP